MAALKSIASPIVEGGKIVGVSQSDEQKARFFGEIKGNDGEILKGATTSQDVDEIRKALASGDKRMVILGEFQLVYEGSSCFLFLGLCCLLCLSMRPQWVLWLTLWGLQNCPRSRN